MNGLTRPFFGWISDRIGRENTMFIAFILEALAVYGLLSFADDPVLFVVLSGLVFFAWGEIYGLFPALCTDLYGRKFATANYGLLYTAKGTAALVVPLANLLPAGTGSWRIVFMIAAAFDLLAALLALVVLKPLRKRLIASDKGSLAPEPERPEVSHGGVVSPEEALPPMKDGNMTDFSQIPEYGRYADTDEYRSGLMYPAVLEELGELRGKRILDIGTGNSPFPRLMAHQGAAVVGYDRSPKQIELARAHQDAQGLNIEYIVALPQTFSDQRQFDAATSIMVLPYAENVDDLGTFFRSANRHLIAGGKFVSVTVNPRFTSFQTKFSIRRITKLEGNAVKVEFLTRTGEPGLQEPLFWRQYTETEYEQAASAAGMDIAWKSMMATPHAVAQEGEEFWRPVHETQPYILLVAQKR
jgi:SAM-dependent methyltransferase